MTKYKPYLLEKYEKIITKVASAKPRITLGDLIDDVFKEVGDIGKTRSEIRDAIMIMTGNGSLVIDAISQKRLEVNLSSKVT